MIISDSDLCLSLNINKEDDKLICITLRNILAKSCNIPKEEILIESNTEVLYKKAHIPLSGADILLELCCELDIPINIEASKVPELTALRFMFIKKKDKPDNFGSWILDMLNYIKSNRE